jgi:hypothetical protein
LDSERHIIDLGERNSDMSAVLTTIFRFSLQPKHFSKGISTSAIQFSSRQILPMAPVNTTERLAKLRALMQDEKVCGGKAIHAYIVPSEDAHQVYSGSLFLSNILILLSC